MLNWINELSHDDIIILSRAVITNALLDISKNKDVESIFRWIKSNSFESHCDVCGLDDSWVKKIFYMVNAMDGSRKNMMARKIKFMIMNGVDNILES